MNLIEETHQRGALDLDLEAAKGVDMMDCDVGLQTAQDGRIWLCLNGRALVRFKPAKWVMDSKRDTNGVEHTLEEWRALFKDRLRLCGVPPKTAERRVNERLTKQAAENLNAMAHVKGAQILFDAFVAQLKQVDVLTPGQRKLQKKHGTPAEFATAVYNCVPGDISMGEARAALEKYQKEWDQA